MSKIRRVIRKVKPAGTRDVFDEAVWPTYVALVVLGGFMMGVSAAYLKFSHTPWYANAITWLFLIPLAIGGLMVAFQFIDNRVFRRSMQFSIVVAALLHAILVVQLGITDIWDKLAQAPGRSEEQIETRPPRVLPEYHPSQLIPDEDRPREEHEKPVETPNPEPRPEEVTQREPEKPQPQATAQPVPVPEIEQKVKTDANVVRKNQENMTNPRYDESPSKLSRQQTPSQMKVSQQVDVPQQAQQAKPSEDKKPLDSIVQRQQAPSDTPRRAPQVTEPTTAKPNDAPQVARATNERAPQAETTAQPTLPKQQAQPVKTPTTQVAAADNPAASKETSPSALAPKNTEATKQVTASPETNRAVAEATPQVTANPQATVQRRQDPSPNQPTVAQANTPTPNKQPRVTDRPDVATAANQAGPAPDTDVTSKQIALTPQQSAVEKTQAAVTSSQPTQVAATAPNRTDTQAATKIARAEGQQSPTATANPQSAPHPSRSQTKAPSIAASQTAENVAAPTANRNPAATEVAATSTAVRRQQTTSAEVATATAAEPTPAQVANNSPNASSPQVRRAAGQSNNPSDAPTLAQANTPSPAATRGSANQTPNIATTAANVATNSAPSTSVNPQPGASSSLVSRQPTDNAPGASRAQPSAEIASASASANIASPGGSRAQQSSAPTMNSNAAPSNAPARSANTNNIALSPQAIESPAVKVADQGASDPTANPARMALNKGLAGTAGVGQSPNLDSSAPNAPSPAMVASTAAQRAQATQEMARGDALSPSAPAQVGRSRADASVPQATLTANEVEVATTGGTREASEMTASSSAALTRAAANAPAGNVTAAKGSTDIDLGPTAIVGDTGSGRAAGGGQPTMNFETKSSQLAKSEAGGAAQMSLAASQVDPAVAAPAGDGGGQPKVETPGPAAVAANRSVSGGQAALSGGPSAATEQGPLAESSTAALLAEANVSRAENAEGASGASAAGQPSIEDEEEKARRLARAAAGGAPQLAVNAATVANVPASPMGDGGSGGTPNLNPDAISQATAVARATSDGGAPAGGNAVAIEAPQANSGSGGEVVSSAVVAKAEAASGSAGPTVTGGGTDSPQKAASGPTFAANVQATAVEVAGGPDSSGKPNGAAIEAQGVQVAASSGGAQGAVADSNVGAALTDAVVVASSNGPAGPATGRRQTSAAEGNGPTVGNLADAGSPGKQAAQTTITGGGGAVVEVPQMGEQSAVAQVDIDHMGGTSMGKMSKQTGDALAVNIEAADGPGGVGVELSPRVGLSTRQARSDSVTVQIATSRFERQQVGGALALNTSAVIPTDSFARRNARTKGEETGGGKGSPPPQTEDAIEAGLAFLARQQQPDGRWILQGYGEETALQADSAATAMCLLAFQGAGYHHRDHQYKEVVQRGLEFLLKNQKENGDLFLPLDDDSNRSVWLYSHSIATLALCEAYGMTQDESLKEPAQKALDFIVAAQHKERGGWRYAPGIGSDTSVTGWMMMALKSGELANLKVPKETYSKIQTWLQAAQASKEKPHLFRYNPYAPDTEEQRHGRNASRTMTAVGLLMELYTGWKRDNPNMIAGAEYLKKELPSLGTPREPQRDTYYWYYGTQVMFHMGGEYWAAWNGRLHPLLIESQVKEGPMAGSWNPRTPVPDRWAPHAGRLYVTATNLLSLEVYYRHLPLYEDTAK